MEQHEYGIEKASLARENRVVKNFLIGILDAYTILLSPFVPTQCRFYPTCSCYMKEAIEKKGVMKGLALGIKRILKCNPFYPGGYDPVK